MFVGGDWVFVHVPKTGGQSMEKLVSDSSESYGDIHSPLYVLEEKIKPELLYTNKYWKFAFTRNPFDWEVSNYFWHTVANRNGRIPEVTFDQWVRWRYNDDTSVVNIQHFKDIGHESDYWYFKGFGKMPLVGMFLNSNKQFSIDFVGRFETITDDWNHIASTIGLKQELIHRGKSRHEDYRYYYEDEETYQIVKNAKQLDLDVFNYTFDGMSSMDINKKSIDINLDSNYNYYYDNVSYRK
jgi:hypothetical protein